MSEQQALCQKVTEKANPTVGWGVVPAASCIAMFAGFILFSNCSQWNDFRQRGVSAQGNRS